jgi:hypothetical protein
MQGSEDPIRSGHNLEERVMTATIKTTKTTKKTGKIAKAMLGLAALTSVGITMVPTDAEAGWRGRRNVAIGAGIVAGLAGAALLAGAAHARPAYGYGGGYYAPAYAPDCYWVRQRRETWDGYVVVRRVRVCD